jgi:putative methionine-R-sulfoxide reductase with GAF domain
MLGPTADSADKCAFEVVSSPRMEWKARPATRVGAALDERRVIELCERAVRRLAEAVPGVEVGALQRTGNVLRHIAHVGELRLIYEVRREQGGVAWRAADTGEVQLVEDVRSDPDYLASDERVRAEIAAPVHVGADVAFVLDVEFPGRGFSPEEARRVEAEADRLGREAEEAGYSG